MTSRILALSVGCPAGIGPEVAVAAASATGANQRCVLVCDPALALATARALGLRRSIQLVATRADVSKAPLGKLLVFAESSQLTGPVVPGQPNAAAGRAQLAWIDQATDLVRRKVADGLVTGPVAKATIASSGARGARHFRGHTEHLAKRLGAREVVMAFAAPELVTALVTTHLALRDVPGAISSARVSMACYWTARLLQALGVRHARIAVAALNPHAGEGGMFGDEEARHITPGIERAKTRLLREDVRATLSGPLGAETAFRRARAGSAREFDAVVAMYHDQATIPSKLLGFGEATNVTLGLPIVRTSVDHGTGYDIAGSGRADPSGMLQAIALAATLTATLCRPAGRASRTGS